MHFIFLQYGDGARFSFLHFIQFSTPMDDQLSFGQKVIKKYVISGVLLMASEPKQGYLRPVVVRAVFYSVNSLV